MNEAENIRERYLRREELNTCHRYNPLRSCNYMSTQEKERAIIRWINSCNIEPVENKRLLEVGCGSGGNLLFLISLGFRPENLVGNELLEDRIKSARQRLPAATNLLLGDASKLDLEEESFDVVLQSTVFTSIIDNAFQQKLANKMWALTKPGGGILWYDFTVNNPNNPDVRGVPVKRVYELFPEGQITSWRLTLAPPINRRVTAIHPLLYNIFNVFPILRTHVLCWIKKQDQ